MGFQADIVNDRFKPEGRGIASLSISPLEAPFSEGCGLVITLAVFDNLIDHSLSVSLESLACVRELLFYVFRSPCKNEVVRIPDSE
jgi:hypothetical protein